MEDPTPANFLERLLQQPMHMNCQEMTLDMVILTHLEANRHCFEGQYLSINYWFHGHRVYKSIYLPILSCRGT